MGLTEVHIPTRFQDEILTHLTLSLIDFPGHPVIMGIFGAPGEGKSFQLRSSLESAGVHVVSVSAADMESDRAGQPAKLLVGEYVRAAHQIAQGIASAIVMDDVDTTVGEWEQDTGTVNHQQILAQLMHLADRPTEIERVGVVRRVPIYVTGNDQSKLYPPLRRAGRMYGLRWQPTVDEREDIVAAMFEDLADRRSIQRLISALPEQPIAFFADLRAEVVRRAAYNVIAKATMTLSDVCARPQEYRRFVAASAATLTLADKDLVGLAKRLAVAQQQIAVSSLPPKALPELPVGKQIAPRRRSSR